MKTKLLCLLLLASSSVKGTEPRGSSAQARAARDGADFRKPVRSYETFSRSWRVHLKKVFVERKPERAGSAVAKLEAAIGVVLQTLPVKPRVSLSGIDFYLLWGPDSPQGGRASGMNYIRKGEPDRYPHLDPRWEHSIVIFSAENLLFLDDIWTRKAVMHELAHAWHLSNWPEKHPPILEAWFNSEQKKLYREVKDYKGKPIAKGYACQNQLEYFAELSAMYFVGGNYEPFNRTGLLDYDPDGHAMVESLWGLAR